MLSTAQKCAALAAVAMSFSAQAAPLLPPKQVLMHDLGRGDRMVSARGTWIIHGDVMGEPVQTTQIMCWERFGHCTSATAVLTDRLLHVRQDTYEIDKWTRDSVTFRDDAICVYYLYEINWQTKRAVGTRFKKANATDCSDVGPPRLEIELVDGWESPKYNRKRK